MPRAEIVATPKLLDSGEIGLPIRIGQGAGAREIEVPLPWESLPARDWAGVMAAPAPHPVGEIDGLWLYRGKFVRVRDTNLLSEEEIRLEVAHAVLKHEKRYQQLRRTLAAFTAVETADTARRTRIPDTAKLRVATRWRKVCEMRN